MAQQLKMACHCMFIYSLPDESREDILMTLDFMAELNVNYGVQASIQPAMIFPGTDLEKSAIEKNILLPDFSWYKPYEQNLVNEKLGQLLNCPLYYEGNIRLEFYEGVGRRLAGNIAMLHKEQAMKLYGMSFKNLMKSFLKGDSNTAPEIRRRIYDAFIKVLKETKNK